LSSYRFCRTDDIGLLVDALNRCWLPHFPEQGLETAATFKRSIRDLQVWCSSCMVAFSGSEPIGVLIGAKRPTGTLIHKIAVHPDHLRQGHGRHLLESLGSKLAILGPPRMVAEVPESLDAANGLFSACGYVEEAVLTDYVLTGWSMHSTRRSATLVGGVDPGLLRASTSMIIPVTVDDITANDLLPPAGGSWSRSIETISARKNDVSGWAAVSDERFEAYILYIEDEIVALRTLVPHAWPHLEFMIWQLLQASPSSGGRFRLPKVHPSEFSEEQLERLGFRPAGSRHRLFAARARAA
jgi:GNAT superfamily N-acetyltransferase